MGPFKSADLGTQGVVAIALPCARDQCDEDEGELKDCHHHYNSIHLRPSYNINA